MENASKALIIAGAILISILLISIGIILINSGRDVAETGTIAMKSQSLQAFNAQFLPYEGVISGARVRELYQLVQTTNAIHPDNWINIAWNAIGGKSQIKSNQKYTVELLYAEEDGSWAGAIGEEAKKFKKGYIYAITVDDS